MRRHYALWLLPQAVAKKQLDERIQVLAKQHTAPIFQPHLTLLGRIQSEPARAIDLSNRVADMFSTLLVKPLGLGHTASYFRCLFIITSQPQGLLRLRKTAQRLFAMPLQAHYHPHISLLYACLSPSQRQRLVCQITMPTAPLYWSYLALVCMGYKRAPQDWSVYRKYSLS